MIKKSPVPEKEVEHAIQSAIQRNEVKTLGYLLECDKDLFRRETAYGTWLHRAADHGGMADEELYRFILDNGGRDVIETRRYGHTPLFMARLDGNFLAEDVLREYGADASPEAMNGFNDLHFLAHTGYTWKLQPNDHYRPADFHALNDEKETPLDCMIHQLYIPVAGGSLQGTFAFLLEGRAHCHPEKGLWQPEHPAFYFNELAKHELLPVLFRAEYWTGIEGEAVKLRGQLLEVLDEPWRAKLAAIDFSPFERGAPAEKSAAEKFLRPRTNTPADRGRR